MSNSQKVAIFFIPVLIDDLQIYVIDVYLSNMLLRSSNNKDIHMIILYVCVEY